MSEMNPSTKSVDTQDPYYLLAEQIEDLSISLPASARLEFATALAVARTFAQVEDLCQRYDRAYWFRRDNLRFWITAEGERQLRKKTWI